MHPILFSIGPIKLYSYGLLLAVAFLVSTYLALGRARLFDISRETIIDLAAVFLIWGIIGGRIFYVLLNLRYFIAYPFQILMIHRGGLVFFGGFISAFLGGIIFARSKKLSVLDTADCVAPFIAIGHAIGRIGCFLNGCCYGKPTDSAIGITFPGNSVKVYPTQLLSSAGLFIIFAVLFYIQKRRRFKGELLALYLILYGTFRFLMDFLRGDLFPVFYSLTITQLISLTFITSGLFFYKKWRD